MPKIKKNTIMIKYLINAHSFIEKYFKDLCYLLLFTEKCMQKVWIQYIIKEYIYYVYTQYIYSLILWTFEGQAVA